MAGVFAVSAALLAGPRLQKVFLIALGILLVGYAFFSRGFAYLGYRPIYVGEIVLALGVLAVIGGGSLGSFRSPLVWLFCLYALWGAIRTVPYIGVYGVDALRDAVIWGYGLFAILISSFLLRTGWLSRLPRHYARWLPWFLLWVPVSAAITHLTPGLIPQLPISGEPLIVFKPGDMAVHLAGVAVFLMLGLHRPSLGDARRGKSPREWVWWVVWGVSFLIVAADSRAALLDIVVPLAVVLAFRPSKRWIFAVVIAAVLIAASSVLNIQVELRPGRFLAPRQILTNLVSTFGSSDDVFLAGPRRWRLEWWGDIINYTVFGPYFWTGKGFGVNLAVSDGFQLGDNSQLRSPHNGNLTVLARTGVPGFVLWALLQGSFGICLLRAYGRSRVAKDRFSASLQLWVLAYWIAFMINGTFDVFFEGPQGGIWLWSIMGVGIALIERQRSEIRRQAERGSAT